MYLLAASLLSASGLLDLLRRFSLGSVFERLLAVEEDEVPPWKNIFIRETICSDGRNRLIEPPPLLGGDFGGDEARDMSVRGSCEINMETHTIFRQRHVYFTQTSIKFCPNGFQMSDVSNHRVYSCSLPSRASVLSNGFKLYLVERLKQIV